MNFYLTIFVFLISSFQMFYAKITPTTTRTNSIGLSLEDRNLLNAQKKYFEFITDNAALIKDFIITLDRINRNKKLSNHDFNTEFFEGIKLLIPVLLDFKNKVLPTIEKAVTVKTHQ